MPDSFLIRTMLATLVLLSFGIYQSLNVRRERVSVLSTGLDEKIPLLPAFSVPYLLYFPYLFFVVVYGILQSPQFMQIAASAVAVQLAAAAVYRFHQTHVPRPPVPGNTVFCRLTAFIYRFDPPYCTFPSLHVAYSLLCAYWARALFPGLAPLFMGLTAVIIASTVFLKQHVVADVVGGAAVAVLSILVIV